MASQNGWPLSPKRSRRRVPGSNAYIEVVTGKAGDILLYVAEQFHKRVEPLRSADTGGYSYRKIAGTGVWSNHASASAIDLNWDLHPYGKRGTFSAKQVKAIREILAECAGVVRWGGDYSGSGVDEQHFEIVTSPSKLAGLKIPALGNPSPVDPGSRIIRKGDTGEDVAHAQTTINLYNLRAGNNVRNLNPDGDFGDLTDSAVRAFQRGVQLDPDGIIGPETWAALLRIYPAGSTSGSSPVGGVGSAAPKISRGSRGKEVEDVQAFLNRYAPGYSSLAVDGIFGEATATVVQELNGRLGLPYGSDFTSETAVRVGYNRPPFGK